MGERIVMSLTRGAPVVDPIVRPGRQPSASRMEMTDRLARGVVGVGSTRVSYRNGKIMIQGGSSLDLSKFCFGFTISGPVVTIKWGEITWGQLAFVLADQDIEITADKQYVGLECTYDAAAIIGPSTDVATFRSDDTCKRIWLYRFAFTPGTDGAAGRASLDAVGKPIGNWDIGSEFSAS